MQIQHNGEMILQILLKFLAIWVGVIGLNLLCFYFHFVICEALAGIHMFPIRMINLITGSHISRFSLLSGIIINSLLFTILVLKTRTFIINHRKD